MGQIITLCIEYVHKLELMLKTYVKWKYMNFSLPTVIIKLWICKMFKYRSFIFNIIAFIFKNFVYFYFRLHLWSLYELARKFVRVSNSELEKTLR